MKVENAVVAGSGNLQIGNASSPAQGELRATNSKVSVGSLSMPGFTSGSTNYGQWVTLNNSELKVNSTFDIGSNGRVVAKDSDIIAGTIITTASDASAKANIELTNGSLTAESLTNNGKIEITNAIVKIDKVVNHSEFYVSGTSTVQIGDATGTDFSFRITDGTVLNDSYIKAGDNTTFRMLGSLTVNGGLDVAYLHGAQSDKGGIGGTLTIEDETVLKASYGVEFSNNYTINGGTIELSGGNASGNLWGFVFQHAEYEINSDIVIDGNAPLYFTYATAVVNSSINHASNGKNIVYINTQSDVTIAENGELVSDGLIRVVDSAKFTVDGGSVSGKINNQGLMTVIGDAAVNAQFSGNGTLVIEDAMIDAASSYTGSQNVIRFLGNNVIKSGMDIDGRIYVGKLESDDEADTFVPAAADLTIKDSMDVSEIYIGAQYKDGIPTDAEGNKILSVVNVQNNSKLVIDKHGGAGLAIRNSGVLNIESGSTVSIMNDIAATIQGAINVYGTFTNTDL